MRSEMPPGAFSTRHDHPIEEFYMGHSGEVIMDIEDQTFCLGAADVVWTGVGSSHAYCHAGHVPFQWLETQTPQVPPKHGTRHYVAWEKLRAGRRKLVCGGAVIRPAAARTGVAVVVFRH